MEETAPSRRSSRRSRRRFSWLRRLAVSVVTFALLVVVGLGAYAWYLSSKVSDGLQRADLLGQEAPLVIDGKEIPRGQSSGGKDLVTGEGTNYLLIGSDARPGDTASRADVIQLIHVNKPGDGIWMIHFPRDLYVDIPGRGKDKINAAYAYGGAPLLVKTMEDLTGVQIDHVAQTDFPGFVDLTDSLGGVRVYAEEGGGGAQQGWNDLDGEQALAFVRERYSLSQGDISRGERQQAWLNAILAKTLTPGVLLNPGKLNSVIESGTAHTTVDSGLTAGEIRSQALALRGVRGGDIHQLTAPWSGFDTTSGGASIVVLDEGRMADLASALQTDDMAGYSD